MLHLINTALHLRHWRYICINVVLRLRRFARFVALPLWLRNFHVNIKNSFAQHRFSPTHVIHQIYQTTLKHLAVTAALFFLKFCNIASFFVLFCRHLCLPALPEVSEKLYRMCSFSSDKDAAVETPISVAAY